MTSNFIRLRLFMSRISFNFPQDPYINPQSTIHGHDSSLNSSLALSKILETKEAPKSSTLDLNPQITKAIEHLNNYSIIVYRGSPTGHIKGPNLQIPILNIDTKSSEKNSNFDVVCTSTYPKGLPYAPIADRYEVRHFHDSWIMTLTDGCGLKIASRLAPKAALEGFWQDITAKLKGSKEAFNIQKMAHLLFEAMDAGHYNIYWDAYTRSNDGLNSYRNQLMQTLEKLKLPSNLSQEEVVAQKATLKLELELVLKALQGDKRSKKMLIEKDLNKGFYENLAGATTFLCSSLMKASSNSEAPFYLLTMSLGDCQGFVYRNGELHSLTKDTKDDISNARDPGGKIGLCTPTPLQLDNRNLQYSVTPCFKSDLLLFMTDGVIDNLDPQRLGLEPKAIHTDSNILQKFSESASLNENELNLLLSHLDLDYSVWEDAPLKEANEVKIKFAKKLLETLIEKSEDKSKANQTIVDFCKNITSDFRDNDHSFFNIFSPQKRPLGKPDHTTCLAFKVPS